MNWFNYKFWMAISFVIFIFYFFSGGLTYINCLDAIKGYISVFKNNGKISVKNLLFFILFPFTLSTATNLYTNIDVNSLNVICVIVSIMTAMLFSLMTIIDTKHTKIVEEPKPEEKDDRKSICYTDYKMFNTTYKETVNIVTCEVLVSVLLLILCFAQPMTTNVSLLKLNCQGVTITIKWLLNWLILFLFYSFILNLLIVTKRFYRFTEK